MYYKSNSTLTPWISVWVKNKKKYNKNFKILVEKSAGHCSLLSYSNWNCDNTCIPFTDQCNGKCYADLEECGDDTGHCIPKIPHELKQYSYQSCQGQCISEKHKCECNCPDWLEECGDKCLLPGELNHKYKVCMGRCIPISEPCTGKQAWSALIHPLNL